MRPSAIVALVLTGLLCLTAFPRSYDEADGAAGALGAVLAAVLIFFGIPALVRFLQRRGSAERRAEPFWTPPFAWAAFGLALLLTLAQAARNLPA